MSRSFTAGYLYGWRPGEHSGNVRYADYKFVGDDVDVVELSERAGDLKDTAKVQVQNNHGKYTNEDAFGVLQHGDRVEFQTRYESQLRAYGEGTYGTGLYQPTLSVRWTGLVRNYSVDAQGRHVYSIDFDAEDFAYSVMSMRRVTNAWTDEQIVSGAGDGQGIINTILANECPELDLSNLPSLGQTTSIRVADKNVLEVIIELANRADLILYARGTAVHLEHPDDIASQFDVTRDDYTLWSMTSNDDALVNRVRVEGGDSHEEDDLAQQTTHDAWETVTKSSRKTRRVTARKGEIDRIELYTDPTRTDSGEDLVVRLQKDVGDGSGPVAPDDTKSDIARKKLSYHFMSSPGWTTFIMPDHQLPDPDPWVIVESGGDTGQDIGIRNSDSDLAFITHYPYNIRTRRDAGASQDLYRLREDTIQDSTISELGDARDTADALLDRKSEPEREFEFDADSDRMHELRPGDMVRLDIPEVAATGRFVVMERDAEWEGSREHVGLTVKDLSTL